MTAMPNTPTITANQVAAPPSWALLELKLIALMEKGAHMMSHKYAERSGAWYWSDDLDDYYERSYNWCLLYNMGGDESLVDLALKHWNATTRLFDDRDGNRINNMEYFHGVHPMQLKHNIHNEYFSIAHPGDAEWHHMGEGNMAFYDLALGDPTISENVRRSRRFADMFLGEDPESPIYDPVHKIIRSPMHGSLGPFHDATLDMVKSYLHGGHASSPDWKAKSMGVRGSLYPVVKDLQPGWWDDPKQARDIVALFNKVVLNGDSAANLAATGLVTNAYLYTGDDKYKQWVVDYVEAWMDRIEQNGGIIPDNVGPTGKPGEHRDGVWWGTLYGWNSYVGWSHIFHSLGVASECAHLVTQDASYLDILRSQINVLLDNSITDENGQLLVPNRATPDGWVHAHVEEDKWDATSSTNLRLYELAHLYHASMSQEDYDLILRVREGDHLRDWNEEALGAARAEWDSEYSRFQYYDGKNPDWPEKALSLQYQVALENYHTMENDDRTVPEILRDNQEPRNAVFTKILTHVMFGSPQYLYHGGLLRATVRYFDPVRMRPGLPPDVAVLVDELALGRRGRPACQHQPQRVPQRHHPVRGLRRAHLHNRDHKHRRRPPGHRGQRQALHRRPASGNLHQARRRTRPLLQQAQLRLPLARRHHSRALRLLAHAVGHPKSRPPVPSPFMGEGLKPSRLAVAPRPSPLLPDLHSVTVQTS